MRLGDVVGAILDITWTSGPVDPAQAPCTPQQSEPEHNEDDSDDRPERLPTHSRAPEHVDSL
jgi:hypothetical protein